MFSLAEPMASLGGMPIEAERVNAAPVAIAGPEFELIEETTWEALEGSGRQSPFERPVLVQRWRQALAGFRGLVF